MNWLVIRKIFDKKPFLSSLKGLPKTCRKSVHNIFPRSWVTIYHETSGSRFIKCTPIFKNLLKMNYDNQGKCQLRFISKSYLYCKLFNNLTISIKNSFTNFQKRANVKRARRRLWQYKLLSYRKALSSSHPPTDFVRQIVIVIFSQFSKSPFL